MANLAAIRSVGTSLADYLTNAYRTAVFPAGTVRPTCTFEVVSSSGMQVDQEPSSASVRVLIYLYRVSVDPHLRNSGRTATPDMRMPPLSVNLHFLFSFWTTSAENEHLALAWTMRQLHTTPLLDGTILSADARWSSDEVVQLIPSELSNEDTMRIWDALRPDYHLSVAYIARVVRIDPDVIEETRPVAAMRLDYAAPNSAP